MNSSDRLVEIHSSFGDAAREILAAVLAPVAPLNRPGLAVAIVNQQSTSAATAGYRDRRAALPVTCDTRFGIGSLTKAFTATLLLRGLERGLVSIDTPLNAERPRLVLSDPAVTEAITATDILSHRSGLPANDLLWYFDCLPPDDLLRSIRHLPFVPDGFRRTFTYNNLLYGAVGHLIGGDIATDWETAVRECVLEPLNMSATSCRLDAGRAEVAHPYAGPYQLRRVELGMLNAAGGLQSSLTDMVRWLQYQATAGGSDTILSAWATSQMRIEHVKIRDANPVLSLGLEWLTPQSYGLGWFIGRFQDHTVLYHVGLIDGFSAAIALAPAAGLGCVVLSNDNLSSLPGQIVERAFATIAAQPIGAVVHGVLPSSDVTGVYTNAAYGVLQVVATSAGEVVVRYRNQTWPLTWRTPIEADCQVEAFGLTFPVPIRFESHGGGIAACLAFDPRGPAQRFMRTSSQPIITDPLGSEYAADSRRSP